MEPLETLTKILDKAEEGGWKIPNEFGSEDNARLILSQGAIKAFLFNHDLAKAFFGEEILCVICGSQCATYEHCCTDSNDVFEAWKYHLQQMVLVPKPLEYMEKFL